jgi:hypothetical protein
MCNHLTPKEKAGFVTYSTYNSSIGSFQRIRGLLIEISNLSGGESFIESYYITVASCINPDKFFISCKVYPSTVSLVMSHISCLVSR